VSARKVDCQEDEDIDNDEKDTSGAETDTECWSFKPFNKTFGAAILEENKEVDCQKDINSGVDKDKDDEGCLSFRSFNATFRAVILEEIKENDAMHDLLSITSTRVCHQ